MLYAIESMRRSMDQKPVGLLPPNDHSSEAVTEKRSFEEVVQPLTPPTKKRRLRCSRRLLFKRRRRIASFILILLLTLAVGGLLFWHNVVRVDDEPLTRVTIPSLEQTPEEMPEDPAGEDSTEEASTEDASDGEATKEEESTAAIPEDSTLYLTVPRLGLYGHTVRNDDSEASLDLGAIKLPPTGFPWQKGSNTYIACHRLGWPGTESFNQCLNLPSVQVGDKILLEDANGAVYKYRVVETLVVEPDDTWVTDPVAGKDMVSLQTCIEAPDDPYTLGPHWASRFVVRGERVAEEHPDGFRRMLDDSAAAYAGLLHTPSFSRYYDGILGIIKRGGHHAGALLSRVSRAQSLGAVWPTLAPPALEWRNWYTP
jgi:sortase A